MTRPDARAPNPAPPTRLRRCAPAFACLIGLAALPQAAGAADLGGDCCADLEERVAELEATTARKGNRKVSLTVSGWVNQAVFFWDDGVESNAYVGTNGLEQDRFRFLGEAKISSDWAAGYILEIGLNGADSKTFSQASDGTGNNLQHRKSAWFVKSKDLGKLTVGKFDPATYHLIDNVDMLLTRNVSDYEAAGVAIGAFQIRTGGNPVGTTRWIDIMGGFQNSSPGQSGLRNVVRYDTPTLAGFVGSASWGEDDQWELALNYRNDIGDWKINGSIGYGESTDPVTNGGQCTSTGASGDCQWWAAGALVQHIPTGIYVYGGYGLNQIDLNPGVVADDEAETWYVQAGIERKWFPLGKTNVFGEYRKDNVGLSKGADSSDLDLWAAGIVQNIEAADMSFYAVYRHYEGDITDGGATTNLDDFDMVITGAKINF
ncbi:MAG: porin [Hyphomicrobium sp.]|uniref:porin n=1 Tax=Hyphomicrobium sp. TaxID=82 RepID=UPI003D0EC548